MNLDERIFVNQFHSEWKIHREVYWKEAIMILTTDLKVFLKFQYHYQTIA